MELEFRHLRIVCAIADAGSVTRASTLLGLSQPALTHQLQRIENLLGGRLFVRDRQGAHPTALGEFVLNRGRALLSAVDNLVGDRAQTEAPRRSTTTLVRFATTAAPACTAVLEALQAKLPDALVTMRTETKPRRMLELLAARRRLDLAMLGEYPALPLPRPDGIAVATITEVPVFVMMSSAHPLAGREEVELAELADEKWILRPEREQRCAENLRLACAGAGFEPHVAHWLELEAHAEAIHRGHGVTIARPGTPDTDKVAVRPLRGSPIMFRDLLAWPVDGPVAPFGADLVTVAARTTWQKMTSVAAHAAWLTGRAGLTGWA
ncbi:MAG TPA: LysR family transcriptional regulator [Actinophytocola sp.]|uniref:LysR family transcriptional regulator n=1 Tax=Actinophytocola sp. TaxID=1872138 RepID=UPI002DDD85B5|nr:LysR family transcriptional regulator [Actinophytocola sp.]HEV2780460.1 LysR family transcriptional regulator [Actinophytocola sp.]